MFKNAYLLGFLGLFFLIACQESKPIVDIPSPTKSTYFSDSLNLSTEEYYDKVLGALVGSAIGDAMGASTEMWHRDAIQNKYGYIKGLTPAVRERSPEGTWGHNLQSGTTTDDTRWKLLMVKYFTEHKSQLKPSNFANFISDYYQSLVRELSGKEILNSTDALDLQIEKIDWIKEWARVSMAYTKGQDEFQIAQNRFYGGEMSCAGQLYTPMIGLIAASPEAAYTMAFEHAFFDIGYAKDISALVSAMTNVALRTSDIDSILQTVTFVDPFGYQDSRLVGRIAYAMAEGVYEDIDVINKNQMEANELAPAPMHYPGSKLDWARENQLFQALEKDQKSTAFHAGEIWQILIAGLKFGEGDFEKSIQFIVNYGRDNDTVAAVAGMILGAKDGYSQLPENLKTEILRVNKEALGIDLEALAREMVQAP